MLKRVGMLSCLPQTISSITPSVKQSGVKSVPSAPEKHAVNRVSHNGVRPRPTKPISDLTRFADALDKPTECFETFCKRNQEQLERVKMDYLERYPDKADKLYQQYCQLAYRQSQDIGNPARAY